MSGVGRGGSGRLLAAVVGVSGLMGVVLLALYAFPPRRLAIPEHQPAVRVARLADLPVGSSRIVTWGEEVVLVVRSGEEEFHAVEGVSRVDGCLLTWDAEAQRIVSPCGYQVYDLHGHAVAGLTSEPIGRFRPYVRSDVVYVTRE